ncbi:MAG TPA: hypothetical protein VL418_01380 [Devosiaceae bacterium]|jgi:hypothetical protein|nr:hypothetical protein [Devosiaceae bacterium]
MHSTIDPHAFKANHPGLFHFGEKGLFTLVGIAIVSLAIVFGVYLVAENALQAFVELARNAAS